MALVFDLFVEATIIPQESIEKRCEFLVEASSSIVASSCVSHPDIGVQLAIRLLRPHATMMTSSKRGEYAAAISNILEHYSPTTEQYARTLLSLCLPLLSKTEQQPNDKQRQCQRMLLDGCVSVLIQLYRKYERQCNHLHTLDMTLLLLEGVDWESDILPQPWLGTCYRLVEAECFKTIYPLLRDMSSSSMRNENDAEKLQHFNPLFIVKAESMSRAIEQYIANATVSSGSNNDTRSTYHSISTDKLPSAALQLLNVVEMFTLFLADKDHYDLARHITTFLSKYKSSASTPSICLQWWLLRVAHRLIARKIDSISDPNDAIILLQNLSEVKSYANLTSLGDSNSFEDIVSVAEQNDMQSSFHGLLLQTTCAENAMKQISRTHNTLQTLESHGYLDVQAKEELVWSMLH